MSRCVLLHCCLLSEIPCLPHCVVLLTRDIIETANVFVAPANKCGFTGCRSTSEAKSHPALGQAGSQQLSLCRSQSSKSNRSNSHNSSRHQLQQHQVAAQQQLRSSSSNHSRCSHSVGVS